MGPHVNANNQFREGFLVVRGEDPGEWSSNSKTQIWNTSGGLAVNETFDDAKDFSNGLCAVRKQRWGFVDSEGHTAVQKKYLQVRPFSEELAAARTEEGWGYIDKTGALAIEPIYRKALSFSEGLAAVQQGNKIGFIDRNGHFVIPPSFDFARSFSGGRAEVGMLSPAGNSYNVESSGRHFSREYIDTKGEVRLDESELRSKWDGAFSPPVQVIDPFTNKDTLIALDHEFGDFLPSSYPHYDWDFHENLLPIKIRSKVGFLSTSDKLQIAAKFDTAFPFSDGFARVINGGKTGYIDSSGKIVIPPTFEKAMDFKEDRAAVSVNGTDWGYIDRKGTIVIPANFKAAEAFSNGLAKVSLPERSHPPAHEQTIGPVVKLQSRILPDGHYFDFRILDGMSDPDLIKRTVAMSIMARPSGSIPANVDDVRVIITFDGRSMEPTFSMAKSTPAADKEIRPEDSKALEGLPFPDKAFKHDGIITGWMRERLSYMCSRLAQDPTSKILKDEVRKTLTEFGLHADRAHDWISIARSFRERMPIRRNPYPESRDICNSAIGAYLQAWQLDADPAMIPELTDAYARRAAWDILNQSDGNPMDLASAAILTEQYKEAKAQSGEDSSRDQPNEKTTLLPLAETPTWRDVLRWLPIDSETLTVALRPFRTEDSKATIKPDFRRLIEGLTVTEPISRNKDAIDSLRYGKLAFTLHGGRNFRSPTGWGEGTQSGADVFVFNPSNKKSADALMETLRPFSTCTKHLNGMEVLIFDPGIRSTGMRSSTGLHYLCSPYKGIIVNASDSQYLREMLTRMSSKTIDRAFPDTLPEWKVLDLKSDTWAIRHYDKSDNPFDITALSQVAPGDKTPVEDWGSRVIESDGFAVYSADNGGMTQKSVPEPKISTARPGNLPPDSKVVTPSSPTDAPPIDESQRQSINLMMTGYQLGYSFAI